MASGRSSGTPPRDSRDQQKSGKGGTATRGKNPVAGARKRASSGPKTRQIPWLAIGAVVVLLALAGGIGFFLFDRSSQVSPWRPSADNPNPALAIPGVVTGEYAAQQHVQFPQRVAYDRNPPFGGPHDQYWAACNGEVYPEAIRTETIVHSLEHGAVWISYNPDLLDPAGVEALANRVRGTNQMLLSPYPPLDTPIALASWGHELKLSDPNDPRIDQFVTALRGNPNTFPEVGATCDALGPGAFDPANPPPFDPTPPGPDAARMDGSNIVPPGAAG